MKKTVIIWPNQGIKSIEPLIAKLFKDKLNFEIIFFAKTPTDKNFYEKNYKNCFSKITFNKFNIDKDNSNFKKIENTENKALDIEKRYKTTIYNLYFTHRVMGRGFYASGGYNHPRNKTHSNLSNSDLLSMAVQEISYWEKLFKKKQVVLALNLPSYLHDIAKKNNVKSFKVLGGRFNNTFTWIQNKGLHPEITLKELNNTKGNKFKEVLLEKPYFSHLVAKKKDVKQLSLSKVIKKMFIVGTQLFFGKLRGYLLANNAYIFDSLSNIWNYRSSYIKYKRYVSENLNTLKNKSFIYFPLLIEPEVSLHQTANDFFFQLSAINVLSRDLPANYIIAVKEHVLAFGRRPKDFYKQIADLKNIVFIDPKETGLDYIKQATAIACITGSAGWEASVIGKPVISFSKYNVFNVLKHVYFVKDISSLREIFIHIENECYPNTKSKLDGLKFYNAYMKKMFDLKDYDPRQKIYTNYKKIDKSYFRYAEVFFKEFLKVYK